MTELHLRIGADEYELGVGDAPASRLAGGPAALLGDAPSTLRNLDVEAAIERAEDWLMPLVRAARGGSLSVQDAAGRLSAWLQRPAWLTPGDVEQAFTRAFDKVAFGAGIDRELVADIVLLRELVHHADARRIALA